MTGRETRATDEFDVPLGGLQALARLTFERTFMEAAVAEVRFVSEHSELSEADAIKVWSGMGKTLFPVFERRIMTSVSLTPTPSGTDSTTQTQFGWILATADRRTAITLLPSTVVVQTADYVRFSSSLGQPLAKALGLFVEVTDASVVQRIGLRYVNRLQDDKASSPEFWKEHVREPFAGPLWSTLAPNIEALHQQVHVKLDPTAAANLQSGVFREEGADARYSFLVDLDVFREQSFDFRQEYCSNLTRQLNRTALALFAQVLSERYWADLGPRSLDEEER